MSGQPQPLEYNSSIGPSKIIYSNCLTSVGLANDLNNTHSGFVQMPLEQWQARGINLLSRKPVSEFDHPYGKEIFPNVHSEPALVQLWEIEVWINVSTLCVLQKIWILWYRNLFLSVRKSFWLDYLQLQDTKIQNFLFG